jgi:uncharacterized protein (TIGR02145 family)
MSAVAGTYTSSVTFTALGNYVPEPVMQTTVKANCPYVPTLRRDTRDGRSYFIQRLADGNCWMLDNLALNASTENPIVLNSDNSDINSSPSFTYNFTGVGADADPNSNSYCSSLSPSRYPNKCGLHYSFVAATLGTGSSQEAGQNAPDSICPKGWRLPTGEQTTGEYQQLATALAWRNGTDVNDSAWRGLYAGNGGTLLVGEYGLYMSSTSYNAGYVLGLYYDSGFVLAYGTMSKSARLPVRCLAR